MREIDKAHKFKKDLKREIKSPENQNLVKQLQEVLNLLCEDIPLPEKFAEECTQRNLFRFA